MSGTPSGTRRRGTAVLRVADMYRADAAAVAAGVPSLALMENAAAAIVREVRRRWSPRPTLVLCGPGNNGGDGFGVAIGLAAARWPVTAALLGERARLSGDAAVMAGRWPGPVTPFDPALIEGASLVVDAVFGAGLARPVDGRARAVLEALAARGCEVVAVDVPSGVHGDTGAVMGAAAPARLTVTFFRPKPGHLLLPGRALCGELVVADIGIPDAALDDIAPPLAVNGPRLWGARLPRPAAGGHKYDRGHAVVAGGATTTGAARLAARAALGVGAGLVTVAAPAAAFAIYAGALTSVMVTAIASEGDFDAVLADRRKNALLIGPGHGVGEATRARVLATLAAGKRCVLDADALTVFADDREALAAAIARAEVPVVLTPHDGEYARLFGFEGDRLQRALAAAEASGAVVALKGPDTVVAAPDGRAAITADAPPELASAGTGDVLAGLIVGLLAQGADGFDAACMGTWLLGALGRAAGPGLVSERLVDHLPGVLAAVRREAGASAPGDG
ncbi:MAG TPA: NAD(P)H-hydrate dehydratase [Alphaproteobacteria bacterium]